MSHGSSFVENEKSPLWNQMVTVLAVLVSLPLPSFLLLLLCFSVHSISSDPAAISKLFQAWCCLTRQTELLNLFSNKRGTRHKSSLFSYQRTAFLLRTSNFFWPFLFWNGFSIPKTILVVKWLSKFLWSVWSRKHQNVEIDGRIEQRIQPQENIHW